MTREHVRCPVWTWTCDRCGASSDDLARSQQLLPSPEQMRERGWFIAEKFGDRCPHCVQEAATADAP